MPKSSDKNYLSHVNVICPNQILGFSLCCILLDSPAHKDILFIQKHTLLHILKIWLAVIILHFHFQCEQTNDFYLYLETGCIAPGLDMVLDGISIYIFISIFYISFIVLQRACRGSSQAREQCGGGKNLMNSCLLWIISLLNSSDILVS